MNIIVLLGFLGSGKTTCLNHLLKQEKRRVACVVNEFGSLDIDSHILDTNHTIISVTQGSVFCNCKSDELVQAIRQSIQDKISTLYIEASGFSNPSTLYHIIEQELAELDLDVQISVVSIVDAYHFKKLSNVLPVLKNQVEYAQKIVVNKTDLVSKVELDDLHKEITSINPNADILYTKYGKVTNDWIESNSKNYPNQSTFQDKNIAYSTNTICVKSMIDVNNLIALSNEFKGFMIRMKGYIETSKGKYLLQVVNDHMDLVPSKIADNKIVVHTLSFECSIEDIAKLFEKHNILISIIV